MFVGRVVQYFALITWLPHWSPGMLRYAQRRVALARASSGSGSPEDGRATGGLTSRRVVRNAETSRVTQNMEPKHHPIWKGKSSEPSTSIFMCSTFIFQGIPSRSLTVRPWKLTSSKRKVSLRTIIFQGPLLLNLKRCKIHPSKKLKPKNWWFRSMFLLFLLSGLFRFHLSFRGCTFLNG